MLWGIGFLDFWLSHKHGVIHKFLVRDGLIHVFDVDSFDLLSSQNSLRDCLRPSTKRINRKGERGSPCRIPQEGIKLR
jgi:hypothetical protein